MNMYCSHSYVKTESYVSLADTEESCDDDDKPKISAFVLGIDKEGAYLKSEKPKTKFVERRIYSDVGERLVLLFNHISIYIWK